MTSGISTKLRKVAAGTAALLTALGIALAGPAAAATISAGTVPATGTPYALSLDQFAARTSACGSGASVIGDGCSVVAKSDPTTPHAYGRFDPLGGAWIDSQDLASIRWTISADTPFTGISFAMTDMLDQPGTFLNLTTSLGGSWFSDARMPNGSVLWFLIDFGAAVTSASIDVHTRHNDGYGISAAALAPIPLPAAGWLLVAAIGALWAIRRVRLGSRTRESSNGGRA